MMSRANTIIILALSVTALLWIVDYQIQYNFNTEGNSLQKIQQETTALKNENNGLRVELFQKESYATISQEAKQMGFVPAQFIYLK